MRKLLSDAMVTAFQWWLTDTHRLGHPVEAFKYWLFVNLRECHDYYSRAQRAR